VLIELPGIFFATHPFNDFPSNKSKPPPLLSGATYYHCRNASCQQFAVNPIFDPRRRYVNAVYSSEQFLNRAHNTRSSTRSTLPPATTMGLLKKLFKKKKDKRMGCNQSKNVAVGTSEPSMLNRGRSPEAAKPNSKGKLFSYSKG
jgi:YHS domain-containing protein